MLWFNGTLQKETVNVDVLSHAIHYGSAVFEGIRFYQTPKGPAIFKLQEHIERLFYSASVLKMKVPYTIEQIIDATKSVVKQSGLSSGYIRPIILYGQGGLGINAHKNSVDVAIAVLPWNKYFDAHAVKIHISPYIRPHPKSTDMCAKISGNYQNSLLATMHAKEMRFDEALLLDAQGNIAEGAGENIFIVKDGVLYTPALGSILPGITRNTIIELATEHGIQVIQTQLTPEDLKDAQEAFFCGTAAEVTLIEQIDDIVFTDFTLSKKLKDIYLAVVGGTAHHQDWLTFV